MRIRDLLKCYTDPESISPDIPGFYLQILWSWFNLKKAPQNTLEIARQPLWFNKNIQINNECLFKRKLYEKGLLYLSDLLTEAGKFLSHEDFNNRFNVNCSQMFLMSVIDAIPKEWRKQLKHFNPSSVNNQEPLYISLNGGEKVLSKVTSREIYWKILSLREGTPSCIKNWNQRLDSPIKPEDWKKNL